MEGVSIVSLEALLSKRVQEMVQNDEEPPPPYYASRDHECTQNVPSASW